MKLENLQETNLKLSNQYQSGTQAALEKLALSNDAITAATAFVSPTASGLTAEDGKGLQTSLGGLAANLLGKKLFRHNAAARLAGAAGATAASKAGGGLVSPDPEELEDMRRRGEFSKWEYGTRGLRTMGTGAGIGALLASGAGIPAAAAGALAGTGRGAFSGFVISPMMKATIQGIRAKQNERDTEKYEKGRVSKMEPPIIEDSMKALEHPDAKKSMDFMHRTVL